MSPPMSRENVIPCVIRKLIRIFLSNRKTKNLNCGKSDRKPVKKIDFVSVSLNELMMKLLSINLSIIPCFFAREMNKTNSVRAAKVSTVKQSQKTSTKRKEKSPAENISKIAKSSSLKPQPTAKTPLQTRQRRNLFDKSRNTEENSENELLSSIELTSEDKSKIDSLSIEQVEYLLEEQTRGINSGNQNITCSGFSEILICLYFLLFKKTGMENDALEKITDRSNALATGILTELELNSLDLTFNSLLSAENNYDDFLFNGGHRMEAEVRNLIAEQRLNLLPAQKYGLNSKIHVLLAHSLCNDPANNMDLNSKLSLIKLGFEFHRTWLIDTNQRHEEIVEEKIIKAAYSTFSKL